ncbi:hypothetical protein P168DRAFT_44294 [Aspergillus campestris IBT 28561]|uniref:Uncharacterized protein n=1 Tax=Aspergillus campestris (strain IBT 28561) TaxID=1392248 RepID=A0A2I1CXE4_ASPC2|nr:uncharacterized protein P168DRAFT_44294 [Aspergillus campestris IBT 28561]PKY02281.1 hypothetical protein P168DRAFT_44294 [Aspergillus campestris IBT 28561]
MTESLPGKKINHRPSAPVLTAAADPHLAAMPPSTCVCRVPSSFLLWNDPRWLTRDSDRMTHGLLVSLGSSREMQVCDEKRRWAVSAFLCFCHRSRHQDIDLGSTRLEWGGRRKGPTAIMRILLLTMAVYSPPCSSALSLLFWYGTDYLLVVATDVNQSRLMTNRGFHGRASGPIVALLCILQDASITRLQLGRGKGKRLDRRLFRQSLAWR